MLVGSFVSGQDEGEPAVPVEDALGEVAVPEEEVPEEPLPDPVALVKSLGSESFDEREHASQKLWELGEVGLEALLVGQESDDPEVTHRATRLLRRIQTGVTPDTPEDIVRLVESYHRGGPDEKRATLEKLREKDAFPQVLSLYRFEKDPAAIAECQGIVDQVVLPAVEEMLKEEDYDGAEEILRLAPPTDSNLRRRAAFSRERGKAEADLVKARAAGRQEWELALLRAKGDVEGALRLAKALKREDLVAGLSVLTGDPVPYFDWVASNVRYSATMRLHAEIARDRWQGKEKEAGRLAKVLVDEVKNDDGDDRKAAVSLLLNGYWTELEPVLHANFPDYDGWLYALYESLEDPDAAIGVYGYQGTAEEKAQWVDDQIRALVRDPDEATIEQNLLLTVAAFLVARGEREDGFSIVNRLAKVLEKYGDEGDWLEFVGELGDSGTVYQELAFSVVLEAMEEGKEDVMAARAIGALFRESEIAMRHWDRLKDEKDLDPRERLLLLGAIYGMVEMDPERVDPVLKRLLAKAITGKGVARREALADLVEPAAYRDDARDVLDLLVLLAEIDGVDRWANSLAIYYGYMSEWKESAEHLEVMLKGRPNHWGTLAAMAATRVRMGEREKADELLRIPELHAFDEVDRLTQMAAQFSSRNVDPDAEEYLRRILVTSAPRTRSWVSAGAEAVKYAKKRGDWRVAAALMEVDALYDVRDRPTFTNPVYYLRKRFGADLMRGLALHKEGDKGAAMALFDRSFAFLIGDGVLADDFLPLLREVGLTAEHDAYFEKAYERIQASLRAYPRTHNTYNSAAWLASRAARRLDEAEKMVANALKARPKQAAYLDTMAEVWFAKRDRQKAIQWSTKAVMDSENAGHSRAGGSELRGQYERFVSGEFPVR